MLHLELGLHAEIGAFLDGEGLVLEGIDGTGGSEVNGDVGTSFHLQSQREDDALARVGGVGEVFARAEAERLLPFAEGLVVLICEAERRVSSVQTGAEEDEAAEA